MVDDKNKFNKIKYFQEKLETLDEQIMELVSERLSVGDDLTREIFTNNLDLDNNYLVERSFKMDENQDDAIQSFMENLYDICEQRFSYMESKYNSQFASIGNGDAYKFTKEIFNRVLDKEYYHFPCQEKLLENLLYRHNFQGLSIGKPYKTEVLSHLDDMTNQVKEIGEANLVQFYKGRKYGFNTEYYGLMKLFEKKDIEIKGKNIIVLISDESTKIIEYTLSKLHPNFIKIIDINDFEKVDDDFEILINIVETKKLPLLDLSKFRNLETVVDINYNPYFSKLYIDAKANNIKVVNGLYKNIYQVKKSMEILLRRKFEDTYFENIAKDIIKKDINIVLVGMPGAGKTTIGKKLSKLLERKHYDLDKEFKKEYGISSSDFLRYESEDEFRRKEHEIVKKLTRQNGLIISTSGGVVNKDENYYYLKKDSIIFRVDRDLNKLSTKNRPLSEGGIDTLIKMYEDRSEKYDYFTDFVVKNHGDFNRVAYRIKDIFENIDI
ncbi:shikimate kinase [Helcococcus kunzii]|uniref:shikimate kinase n=1 Tax=Helcococcus kunzii TaxID=40091 RepID=UPI0021A661AE|nr:shikimate kinase [Helcococcus kunzii]MCT1796189.1 hypothetical protein [Helcococcus kunzii]MCT1988956.1 hypothetical protein [Helcococcus kunzii]